MPHALAETEVLIIDCQSTGPNPARGHLLELGWATANPSVELTGDAVTARLIALPEGERIPPPVTRVTGIRPDDLETAQPALAAWVSLQDAAGRLEDPRAVIHFARFEEPFLLDLHRRDGTGGTLPFDIVCTHEIARRLLPELPRRGLHALAGYFGYPVQQLRRSADHVAATAFVWRNVVSELDAAGVRSWAELGAWMTEPAPTRRAKRSFPMARDRRLSLPDAPGVYRFLRTNGDILYVGKATSLKRRVNSYFQKQSNISERLLEMLTQARDIDVTPTATALEAALLEADEIKEHAAPYNRALRGAERGLCFCSGDLDTLSALPNARARWGPFPSHVPVAKVAALQAVLSTELAAGAVRAALRVSERWAPDLETFAAGLAVLRQKYDLDRGVLTLGRRAWPPPPRDIGDDEEDEPPEWTAEAVAEQLERNARALMHLLRRARWLVRLSESAVSWKTTAGAHRCLIFERGAVVNASDRPTAPPPPGARRSFAERQAGLDLAAYDRLRVLSTELRRIASRARVRFTERAIVGPAALARAHYWV